MEEQDSTDNTCPVCHQFLKNPYFTNCGHQFCDACIAEYVWRQQSTAAPICPVCRQFLKSCSPVESSDKALLLVRVGRVLFEVVSTTPDAQGKLHARIANLFRVPAGRLKLIHKGRLVVGDQRLMYHSQRKDVVTLLSSRTNPQEQSLLRVVSNFASLTWLWMLYLCTAVKQRAQPLLLYGWTAMKPFVNWIQLFISSFNPSWRPPEPPARAPNVH